MNLRIRALFGVVALAAVAIPSVAASVAADAPANHAAEPTAPISGIRLRVYVYGEPPGTGGTVRNSDGVETSEDCDGSLVIDGDKARIETFTQSLVAHGDPTEHYREELTVSVVGRGGGRKVEWSAMWRHANIGPHGGRGDPKEFESSQSNTNLMNLKPKTVVAVDQRLRGDVSGVDISVSCQFTIG